MQSNIMQALRVDDPTPNRENLYARTLEQGDILLFPNTPFELPQADCEFLRSISAVAAARHKNVAYKPALDRVSGFESGDTERLRAVFRSYSRSVAEFVGRILPTYRKNWKLDYASFRSEEEEGRELPWKKRNDLLHVDAFPSRPTNGGLILRVFTNVNPSAPRVWVTSDPFESLATAYASDAGLGKLAANARSASGRLRRSIMRAVGPLLRVPDRSPYDRFMLGFHDYLKGNAG